mmetsp:Transcript_18089/g.29336  ORF Transcript_18089/g.29336 Transcript_18089/m.29336 type:complete len:261 (+) Transcript_18089:827-1609(+)|eukprot:CAMPEP_0203777964 /NCGR_PEP_ID=MMETSP0099_2-20121227/7709_2 /ASSEMBLY_ACC=CAM_ASM_000209 /TAXON_ID=96639 /ORGANISM=" , Strain NY0313808BC1" /LENGTH=260 /DNA_ID=CAMNT_0050677371 /DNA_START=121 /DNA_END=903 /DNA_ORIENTATION=-
MAKSRFEYVRHFEQVESCLRNTFIVVRIDGRGFTNFCKEHDFTKPNDRAALDLMNACAMECCQQFNEIFLGYGQSDEYSFVFRRDAKIFNRRKTKIVSLIVSLFSSSYVFYWKKYMNDKQLLSIPQFDGRIVLYPALDNIKDYFRWRQADCHINNLFNTCFWNLVKTGGMSETEAEKELSGTVSKDKHEILFSRFHINYNDEPEIFRKGSVIMEKDETSSGEDAEKNDGSKKKRPKRTKIVRQVTHIDIMKDSFWASLDL